MNKDISNLLFSLVKDLENTKEKYNGYSYVRTIRNILIGKSDAAIAPNFSNKKYYGILSVLTLEETETIMDSMVKEGQLMCIYTNHGKLYCTPDYHDYLCKRKSLCR